MYERVRDVTALAGRVAVAVVFLAHGLDKWNAGLGATTDMVEAMGIPLPTLSAIFLIAVEVIGSIAFILGIALPLVGIGYAVAGLGALFFVHLDAGLTGAGGYELVLVLALAGLALGFNGGRLSLDHLLFGRRKAAAREQSVAEAVRA
ncbi:DoxX family protein [Prauserella marina]|uniref:Putative oxidoreductase n=1 Tax=Prauserella marina TaxID=530584 RepID=A0A222VYD2_9PSEU|nr:DoxX family protein [Prauserella marina]ASR38938.1 DoxX family protein [Prauserella marina]PWV71956.1 putative oxidoreductase [Prauserella marina]SDD91888.1 putative oxidoreductase [Prauserella marina]